MEEFVSNYLAGTVIQTLNRSSRAALDSVVQWPMSKFNLLLCQLMFGPYGVASILGDLAVAAMATVLVASKQIKSLYILKE